MSDDGHNRIKVVECYRNYSPAFDVSEPVRQLLSHVPGKYLAGLQSITLTNSQGTRHLRRGKTRVLKRRVKLADCRGLYRTGQIMLLIDQILLDYPHYLLRLPFFRAYLVGEVLYHEIGHHIHRTRKGDLRNKETVADEWKDRFLSSFMSRRYWYVAFVAIPYQVLIHPAVKWVEKIISEKKVPSDLA